jgi:hypothetical protein
MKYIKTTFEAYQQYVKEHGTDRIKKGVKLICSKFSDEHPLYEIIYNPLETPIEFKDVSINKYKSYQYIFKCNSGNEYKLDLIQLTPQNYWLNFIHYSVSFTLVNRDDELYDEPTKLGELYEIFKRIMFLLDDFNSKFENIIYVIGNPVDKRKKLLYKDFINSFGKCEIKEGISTYFNKEDVTYYIKLM